MMVDDVVVAPVLSQPSLPVPRVPGPPAGPRASPTPTPAGSRSGRPPAVCVLGLRFTGDKASPPERFAALRELLGDALRRRGARLVPRQPPRPPQGRPLGAHRGPRRPARHPHPRGARPGARPSSPEPADPGDERAWPRPGGHRGRHRDLLRPRGSSPSTSPATGPEARAAAARPPRLPHLLVRLPPGGRRGWPPTGGSVLFDMLGYGLSDKPDRAYTAGRSRPTSPWRCWPPWARPARAADPRRRGHRRGRAPGPPARGRAGTWRSPTGPSPTAASTSTWPSSATGQQLLEALPDERLADGAARPGRA